MSDDMRFVTSNKDKAIYEFRSEVNNHLAPNVTLISSDNAKVKGHSNILASCPYFRELFKRNEATNLKLVFDEDLPRDVLELVIKYIYTGEYSLLDPEKLPEVLRATFKKRYNIPALAKGYLLKQLDAPEGLNQSNWHLFYKNGIKLSLGEEICDRIYAFLKEEHPEFYKSEGFKGLKFDQICKIMESPNRPFESITTIMEATLIWTNENKAGMDKLAELSKICTNPVQNVNPSLQATNSPILDPVPVQSANCSLSTRTITPKTTPHAVRVFRKSLKRPRSISPQIDPQNVNGKRFSQPTLPSPSPSVRGSPFVTHPQPQSVPKSISTTTPAAPSTSTPTRMSTRANSQKNGTPNPNINKSVGKLYHPSKYSWGTAQLLFFGINNTEATRYLMSYSFQTGEIKKMARLPFENLMNSSLMVYQDRIYWIGECVASQAQAPQVSAWSFAKKDLKNMNKAWEKGPKLTGARGCASALLFQNNLFLFPESGGSFNSGIEKWDISGKPDARKVNDKHMLYNRSSFGVALLNNVIYMIGGFGGKKDKTKLILENGETESYNIDDGSQALLPNLRQARWGLRVVALKDRIYAIGGFTHKSEELTSVESYKPGESSWKQVANMNHPRAFGTRTFVLDDKIYVVGKKWGKPTMERYCPQEDQWTMVDINLPEWDYLFTTCVLLGPNNF